MMTTGVTASLSELIALRRFSKMPMYRHTQHAQNTGINTARAKGRGMDFAEVRNYQAGDEIRHMEWRVTARTGRPHIKLFEEERERPVVILVDFNPSMFFGTRTAFKSVIAARLASLIAWTTNACKDRVGGLLFNHQNHHELVPRSHDAGVLTMLGLLAQYTQLPDKKLQKDKPQTLENTLIRLRRVTKPGSLVVLISDFYTMNEETARHLKRLQHHNQMIAYHVCDPLEITPPAPGQYPLTDGQHTFCLEMDNQFIYQAYQTACQQKMHQIQQTCHALSIQYVQVCTHDPLPQLVYDTFPRRGHG